MLSFITFFVCWLCYSKIVYSFSSNSFTVRSVRTTKNLILFSSSYEQMLEQARLKKSQPQQASKPKIAEPQAKREVKDVPKQVSRPRKANTSGLPFDDATYSHMKYVIEKLTGKLRSDISLSPEELIRFKKSVEEIIADAYGDEDSTVETTESVDSILSNSGPTTSSPSSANAFAAFKGLRSTWEVKGADKMTTEEYYNAVNKRIAEVRNLRKSIGEDNTTDSYLKSLSPPKPQAA